jgi:hypothetical protein
MNTTKERAEAALRALDGANMLESIQALTAAAACVIEQMARNEDGSWDIKTLREQLPETAEYFGRCLLAFMPGLTPYDIFPRSEQRQ